MDDDASAWLLLIHQIPPKPDYLRVKIWRRLQVLGAVAVKNSVYVLPPGAETLEDFQWLAREIRDGGGEALVCEARLLDGLDEGEARQLFVAARDADYAQLAGDARELLQAAGQMANDELRARLTRLAKRRERIGAIDFFAAPGAEAVDGLLAALGNAVAQPPEEVVPMLASERPSLAPAGTMWVTRRDVRVDRIASAWLIRRFIDPEARFKFVVARGYRPKRHECRFDMFEAEFTHEGDRCTFEVLLGRTGMEDAALSGIAEIVHDLDLKDGKFGRDEAAGLERLIDGLCLTNDDDEARLAQGNALFDGLYAALRNNRGREQRKKEARP
ncbi:MAG: chromate resistance protein [Alphaproteobacteria bacterium]|nr:chromate resistance protein [Alphaproteobacteria bacterium]